MQLSYYLSTLLLQFNLIFPKTVLENYYFLSSVSTEIFLNNFLNWNSKNFPTSKDSRATITIYPTINKINSGKISLPGNGNLYPITIKSGTHNIDIQKVHNAILFLIVFIFLKQSMQSPKILSQKITRNNMVMRCVKAMGERIALQSIDCHSVSKKNSCVYNFKQLQTC